MPDDLESFQKELAFLRRFVREFQQLDAGAQRRVKRYLADRYQLDTEPDAGDVYPQPPANPNT